MTLLRTAPSAAKAKIKNLKKMEDAMRSILIPDFFETYGGLGEDDSTLNKTITNFAEEYCTTCSRCGIWSRITAEVSKAVQTGNTKMTEMGGTAAEAFT